MNPGDIITYREMCNAENVGTLQRGMNFRLNLKYSVLLMSTTSNAPYDDEVQEDGAVLIYEGHDIAKTTTITQPKLYDQPMHTLSGNLTANGLFYKAAKDYQDGKKSAEVVRVYEKLKTGIWVYNGTFNLIDAWKQKSGNRQVFKFKLRMIEDDTQVTEQQHANLILEHSRFIPSAVKVAVWKRDQGACVKCGSTSNLHYDHIIPYSRGGTSLSAENIQLLCMSCNLGKRDRIE